ncbi:membrane protein insertase YidC [Pseudonocardia kunmingensis]|uniref:Membrane protein insertase YidC n=1 Tax=Pseudonocardia kunmingensis TaxID=630975 RepID=A0A543E3H0_9PSEU|nr:membrane protein insertase YidC [Pseudonocardia kunmingensis]TQM16141.1 YidC/Oxa1 family membrane protein insertase [Pseudonocardia kunmingensis]
MLNFIYYPVSFILWVWHKAFGFLLGPDNGIAWALSVMFLVFTLRAILYKPFVHQVRSMRRMQEFQPEIAKLRKKYANDRQKQAEEMQRLQKEHGVNPLGGCLPVLVQVPVFIGLFHVLREFGPLTKDGLPRTENYFFGQEEVESFNRSDLFGAKLGNWVLQGEEFLNAAGTSVASMLIVMIPLMIAAGIFTHITARHSVARQTAAQAENPQTAIMNRLMLYVFPIGVVVGAPFLPLAVLLYWVSNNLWTLGQQYVVYKRIDAEESAKREQAAVTRQARAPRPGQKPVRPEAVDADEKPAKRPGAKPVTRKQGAAKQTTDGEAAAPGADEAVNGSANGAANGSANGSATDEANAGSGATSGVSGGKSATTRSARSGGGTRPPARRPRKRR